MFGRKRKDSCDNLTMIENTSTEELKRDYKRIEELNKELYGLLRKYARDGQFMGYHWEEQSNIENELGRRSLTFAGDCKND